MRKIIPFLLLLACSSKEQIESPTSPNIEESDEKKEVFVYEGVIRMDEEDVSVELSLVQGDNGLESSFTLKVGESNEMFKVLRGKYSILYGGTNDENKFQLHGKMVIFPTKNLTGPFKPEVRDIDLHFKSDGFQKLVLTDDDFNLIADDSRYTLYKRSRLLTVEGYLTCEKNSSEFFEQNTSEQWNVAPLGIWPEAKRKYDSLATEEFEGIYLKALAYWIASDSTNEDLLVIKKIIQINKSKAYNDDSLVR
jgi:hypothetical protein